MVINIGWLKDKKYSEILSEINEIKEACNGKILKVIIETCLLTNEEKIQMCNIINESNADYIKTSTGFSIRGASIEDVDIMNNTKYNNLQIKASGGIKNYQDALNMIKHGATRIGTSSGVKIIKEEEK